MPNVAPDSFAQFLAGTVLREISIWEAHALRGSGDPGAERKYAFGDRAELVSVEEHRATIHATYGVRVYDGDEAAVTMEITLQIVYETPTAMSNDVFEQFSKVTLRIHTIPFAREWFRDISGRMGIEPILLPLALAHPAAVPKAAPKRSKSESKRT